MSVIKSSSNYLIIGTAEVERTVFGGQKVGFNGRNNGANKLVVVGIEKKTKGVCRLHAWVISNADALSLGVFMKDHINITAKVTTYQLAGYGALDKTFANLVQIPSGKNGGNFPELHRTIMNLKGWLRGAHHHMDDAELR